MAIQNFLSGGFFGKLGDVVGQRWRNKRIIRVHVIPANPRTEKQQANRMQFALATALAQQAFNYNRGSPLWDTSQMGQFSLLVSTAKRRLQAGMSPSDALPLYPDGHDPSVVLSNPSANWSNWPSSLTVSDNSFIFPQTRAMAVFMQVKNEFTKQIEFFDDELVITAGSNFSYTFPQQNLYSLPEGSSIQAISEEDHLFGGQSIQLKPFALTQPSKVSIYHTFNLSPPVQSVKPDHFEIFDHSAPVFDILELDILAHYYSDYHGQWVSYLLPGQSFDFSPFNIWAQIGQDNSFPPGSHIRPGEYIWETETADFFFTSERFDFSWP